MFQKSHTKSYRAQYDFEWGKRDVPHMAYKLLQFAEKLFSSPKINSGVSPRPGRHLEI